MAAVEKLQEMHRGMFGMRHTRRGGKESRLILASVFEVRMFWKMVWGLFWGRRTCVFVKSFFCQEG